jgi:hypothetical protein
LSKIAQTLPSRLEDGHLFVYACSTLQKDGERVQYFSMKKTYWWSQYGDYSLGPWGYPPILEVMPDYMQLAGKSKADIAAFCKISIHMVYRMLAKGEGLDSVKRLRQLAECCEIPLELLGLAEEEPEDLESVVISSRVQKAWKDVDLAQSFGRKKGIINLMEHQGQSLDSLERRRILRFVLGIRPALLGLDALHLDPLMEAPHFPPLSVIQRVQEGLWTSYYAGQGQDQLTTAWSTISLIQEALPGLSSAEGPAWLEQQSLLYQGITLVTSDLTNVSPKKVLEYAQRGVKKAEQSGNENLLALALVNQFSTAYVLGDETLTAELASGFNQDSANSSLVTTVRSNYPFVLARSLALCATESDVRSDVFFLTDENCWTPGNYRRHADINRGRIQLAQALLNLALVSPLDVSDLFKRADAKLSSVDPEALAPIRLFSLKLTQARVALARQELDYALIYAIEAYPLKKLGLRHISHFANIYRTMREKKHTSPDVEHLRWLLIRDNLISYTE